MEDDLRVKEILIMEEITKGKMIGEIFEDRWGGKL